MRKLIGELRRRKVFRVAAVYAVVAWVLIQVADTVLPALQLPEWTVTLFTVLFIFGFPIAIILAWAFDLTPDGVKAATAAQSLPATTSNTDHKLIYATFTLVLLVAGFQIADRLMLSPDEGRGVNDLQRTGVEPTTNRFDLLLGNSLPKIYDSLPTDVSISPDGQNIIYTVNTVNGSELYVRNMNELSPTRLVSIPDSDSWAIYKPSFSPGGDQILYAGRGLGLRVISLQGGQSRRLVVEGGIDPIGGFGWLNEGEVLYVSEEKALRLFSLADNSVELITISPEFVPRWPRRLANQRAFLYTAVGAGEYHIELYDLDTGESDSIIESAYQAQFVSSGHIIFMREDNLWAVPFDPERREFTGPQVQMISGISSFPPLSESIFSVSDSGRLTYLPFQEELASLGPRVPVWVDSIGNVTSLGLEPDTYGSPRLSPDGSKLLLLRLQQSGNADIYIWDFATENMSQLTFHGNAYSPIWTHDSNQIIYSRWDPQRTGEVEGIWRVNVNGFGEHDRLLATELNVQPMQTISDGSQLLYIIGQGTVNNEVQIMHLNDKNETETLIPSSDLYEIAISLDENWAVLARRDGIGDVGVFVSPYPNVLDGSRMVTARGRQPMWSNDNSEIYYINDYTRKLHSATVISTSPFLTEEKNVLLENVYFEIINPPSYDVSPDGSRLLVLVFEDESYSPEQTLEMVIVDNWFVELEQLAPPDPK